MPWSVAAAAVSAGGAMGAAGEQSSAVGKGLKLQKKMWQQTRADLEPYRDLGSSVTPTLTDALAPNGEFNRNFSLADFAKDPGYDFRFNEGQRALENSASARGGNLSGAAIKAQTEYGQGFASNEYQNAYTRWNNDIASRFSRLSDVARIGAGAATTTAQANTNYANNGSDLMTQMGNAQAAGTVGVANAIGGALSGFAGIPSIPSDAQVGQWANTAGNAGYNDVMSRLPQLPGSGSAFGGGP